MIFWLDFIIWVCTFYLYATPQAFRPIISQNHLPVKVFIAPRATFRPYITYRIAICHSSAEQQNEGG